MQYFGADGDRLQMMFNFEVNQALFYARRTPAVVTAASSNRSAIAGIASGA